MSAESLFSHFSCLRSVTAYAMILFFPWIRRVLSDPLLVTPEDVAARLESKAVVYLDRVIEFVRDM